jgi:hypothetical protein
MLDTLRERATKRPPEDPMTNQPKKESMTRDAAERIRRDTTDPDFAKRAEDAAKKNEGSKKK